MAAPDGNFVDLAALDAASADQGAPASTDAPAPQTQILTLPPAVAFNVASSAAPTPLYVRTTDILRLAVANNDPNLTALQIRARLLLPDGTLSILESELDNIPGDGTLAVLDTNLAEGFLLSVVVGEPTGQSTRRGLCYVRVVILPVPQLPATMDAKLIGAYVHDAGEGWWPGGIAESSISGEGAPLAKVSAIPGANQRATLAVPAQLRWKLKSVTFSLTTSAVAGNRFPVVEITIGGVVVWSLAFSAPQGPSVTQNYFAAVNMPLATDGAGNLVAPIPADIKMEAGDSVDTGNVGGKAGDQYSAITAQVEQWRY